MSGGYDNLMGNKTDHSIRKNKETFENWTKRCVFLSVPGKSAAQKVSVLGTAKKQHKIRVQGVFF